MPAFSLRLRTLARPKAFLATALMLFLGGGYFLLQRVPSPFPAVEPPRLGGLDGLVPFVPEMVWIYFSYYLLIPLPALLADGRRELGRAVVGPALVALGAFGFFFLVPTVLPRPAAAAAAATAADAWGYALLVALDRPTNVFPSLHAALSVHAGLLVERVLAGLPPHGQVSRTHRAGRAGARLGLWLWIGAILYSTLALGQHLIADLVAGALLGAAVYGILTILTIPALGDRGTIAHRAGPLGRLLPEKVRPGERSSSLAPQRSAVALRRAGRGRRRG